MGARTIEVRPCLSEPAQCLFGPRVANPQVSTLQIDRSLLGLSHPVGVYSASQGPWLHRQGGLVPPTLNRCGHLCTTLESLPLLHLARLRPEVWIRRLSIYLGQKPRYQPRDPRKGNATGRFLGPDSPSSAVNPGLVGAPRVPLSAPPGVVQSHHELVVNMLRALEGVQAG
jgi:hypothetical protein